jgi:hypothetical protein
MPRVALLVLTWVSLVAPTAWGLAPPSVTIRVGFGEVDVTPQVEKKKPVYLAGFGRDRKATGVDDPLYARAIVLHDGKKKIAMVCADVVGLFHATALRVRAKLPGFDYVLVSSTHNHEGPDTMGLWGPSLLVSGIDKDYLSELEQAIVRAVKKADAASRPASARVGTIKAPELLQDTRLPIVKHDELVALLFRDPGTAKPRGLVLQWNCHPETLGSNNSKISSDFVGPAVSRLQKQFGCPVVYLTGTVGGMMTTLHLPVRDKAGKLLAEGSREKTQRYGELLAAAAAKAVKSSRPVRLTPLEIKRQTIHLPIVNKLYLLARQLGVLDREAFAWTGDVYKAKAVKEVKKGGTHCIRTEIGYSRLGEVGIAAIPGEIYPELVLGKVPDPAVAGADFPDAPIEPSIYAQMPGPIRMLVGLANDEVGYIIPKRQWDVKPPFCYGLKKAQYGEENSLGPDTAPLLCKAFADMVKGKRHGLRNKKRFSN